MDLSTVNNAVGDALAGLPAGTSDFINANIGTPQGQQAILQAAASLGLSNDQIAAAVSQATGMNVSAAQVASVAQQAPAAPPAPTPVAPIPSAYAPPAPTPVASTGTSLSNITAPTQNQPFVSSNPGTPGTSYGQASSDMVNAAAKANPELANALQNGTAQYQTGDQGDFLVDTKTGQQIPGNYTVSSTPSGGVALNIPGANGSMIQAVSNVGNNGMVAPLTSSNLFNVGVNAGAGGFAGGPDSFVAAAGPVIATAFPEVAPYILAYNSASAANKGQYGVALVNALASAGVYAAQNPDSQIGQLVNGAIDSVKSSLPQSLQDLVNTPSTATPSGTSQVGNTTGLGNTDYSIAPNGSTGTGLQGAVDNSINPATGLPTTNMYQPGAIDPSTGLPYTGLGLQPPGSTNLSSMGGGQGLTVPTGATGNTPAGVLGGSGVTATGTGGLPVNTSTGLPVGSALSTLNTGVTTPSTSITNASGNVVGTPAGQNTSSGVLPAAAAATAGGLTAAQIAAAASAAAALANSKTITNANNAAAATQTAAGQNVQDYLQKAYQTQAGNVQGVQNNLANLYAQQQTGTSNVESLLGNLYANQQGANLGYQTAGNAAAQTLASPEAQQYFTNQFNNQDLNAQLAPNYAFQLQQGMGQARNAANVGGGLLSGNTLQGLNTYAQNYAQGAYQNAFTNYQNQRQNIDSNLASQAGIGQTANTTLANLGANLAGQYNQANQNLGNVGANIGATNAGAVQGLGALSGQLANTYGNVTTGLAASQAGLQTANAVNQTNLLSNLANNATLAYLA
jgi:hypothetical protein